jgi:acetolactate synthase-1/2/3 large subunit
MKLAEAVAHWLEAKGFRYVFGVNGGANLHLIHGIADVTSIQFIPGTHECNSGFSADAYARMRGLGCAMATSGPGATNLVTAIAASWYDSVPVLYITGNVASFRQGARLGVKQYGFQETPIVDMVSGITKYAHQPDKPESVIRCLDAALVHMNHGRRGPALVDICDDHQRADI